MTPSRPTRDSLGVTQTAIPSVTYSVPPSESLGAAQETRTETATAATATAPSADPCTLAHESRVSVVLMVRCGETGPMATEPWWANDPPVRAADHIAVDVKEFAEHMEKVGKTISETFVESFRSFSHLFSKTMRVVDDH